MKKQHIIIVGAGLAGLAAGYELAKHPEFKITILEQRDRVGGRVHTLPIAGQPVDFGGFIIYPWYTNYHRILKELGMDHQLAAMPDRPIYYQIDDSGKYYDRGDISFPKKDTARLGINMLKPLLEARDVANPPLDNFGRMTGTEYLRSTLRQPDSTSLYETFFDVVHQGFCYPPVDQFHMSFIAPFIFMSTVHGDVSKASFLPQGNAAFAAALAKTITNAGHTIQLNTTVTDPASLKADKIIFADTTTPNLPYTKYYNAVLELETMPIVSEDARWGGVFFLPNKSPLQITSIVNLAELYTTALTRHVTVNVAVRDGYEKLDLVELQKQIKHYFPGCKVKQIVASVFWTQTMPIATEAVVEEFRTKQGTNNQYYAGDWLGASSMETAVTTGVRAAELILKQ